METTKTYQLFVMLLMGKIKTKWDIDVDVEQVLTYMKWMYKSWQCVHLYTTRVASNSWLQFLGDTGNFKHHYSMICQQNIQQGLKRLLDGDLQLNFAIRIKRIKLYTALYMDWPFSTNLFLAFVRITGQLNVTFNVVERCEWYSKSKSDLFTAYIHQLA